MLKQQVTYTDFNDQKQTETLYFNLSKSQLADNLDLLAEVQDIENSLKGEERTLEVSEVKRILELVKTFVRLSYGIRSADGKSFRKTDEIWEDFRHTAVYDEFLYSLFANPENAFGFILGILPADLRQEAEKLAASNPNQPALTEETETVDPKDVQDADTRPVWVKENREPTNQELATMDKTELLKLMAKRNQG